MSPFRYQISVLAAVMVSITVWNSPGEAHPQIITVAQSQPAQPGSSTWQDFTSSEGGFKVLMPDEPVEAPFPAGANISNIRLFVQMTLVKPSQMEFYGVFLADYAEDLRTAKSIDAALSEFSKSWHEKNRIISRKNIVLGNHRGIAIESQTPEGELQITRCYSVGQRIYVLFTSAGYLSLDYAPIQKGAKKPSVVRSQSMELFLNSFQLLNQTRK